VSGLTAQVGLSNRTRYATRLHPRPKGPLHLSLRCNSKRSWTTSLGEMDNLTKITKPRLTGSIANRKEFRALGFQLTIGGVKLSTASLMPQVSALVPPSKLQRHSLCQS
jgi:hypothetical protein